MSSDSSQTKAGRPAQSSGTSPPPLSGFVRLTKGLDPTCFSAGAASTNSFESALRAAGVEVYGPAKDTIKLQAVYLMDPCQATNSPLQTQTLLPSNKNTLGTFASNALAGVFTGRESYTPTSTSGIALSLLEDYAFAGFRQTSVANTANTLTLDTRNLAQILAIHSDSTGGTSTLTISVTPDNTNFLQIDSIAAAAVTDLQYTQATNALNGAAQAGTVAGTGASTVKLNPLAFRYIKISAGAAGVGIQNTLTISMK